MMAVKLMQIRIPLVFVLMASAGCSVSGLQEKKPLFVGKTEKNAVSVARCIGPRWQDINPSTSVTETEKGYRVLVSDSSFGALVLATIVEGSDGASATIQASSAFGAAKDFVRAAKGCM